MHAASGAAIRSARLSALLTVLVLVSAGTARASAPYMGVDTWYAFGPSIGENQVVALTNATVSLGLKAAGYRYIWLDAGWWSGQRDTDGQIVVNPTQWPHGMAWLAEYIHSQGLRAGIYTGVGDTGCASGGSHGHYQQDVDTFAGWGFDAVKADTCGSYTLNLDPRATFESFATAIADDQPQRHMILSVANPNTWSSYPDTAFDDWAWAPKIAASWRTGQDLSYPGGLTWAHLLRNIDADAAHPGAAGDGHWNDPDYLAPAELTPAQARAQFTMWSILAAPMMVSADLLALPQPTIAMLTNPAVIAISQDRLGRQGRAVARRGAMQVWTKRLADGSIAVAVLNRGARKASITLTPSLIGLHTHQMFVRQVWGRWRGHSARLLIRLQGQSASLLRVSRARR